MAEKAGYEAFLRDYIYGVKDFNEYLDRITTTKGKDFFNNLKIKNPIYSESIISGQ
jgi:hypothetical protein